MPVFNPFWLLYTKLVVLVVGLWGLGTAVQISLGTWRVKRQDRGRSVWNNGLLFLSIPVGLITILFVGYTALRLCMILGLPQPYSQSLRLTAFVAAGLVGSALVTLYAHRRAWNQSPRGSLISGIVLVGVPVLATLLIAWTPWMPFVQDPSIVYFSGNGTDATGYIRVARSMVDEWYFAPRPQFTLDDILYRPEAGWTHQMIKMQDRPCAYYLIAILSSLTSVNLFQAYLLCGPLALILLIQYAYCLIYSLVSVASLRMVLGLLPLFLALVNGMTGNFLNQFLGHIWAITSWVTIAPGLGLIALRLSRPTVVFPIVSFTFCLVGTALYDVRYGLVGVFAFLLTFWVYSLLQTAPLKSTVVTLALSAGAAVAALVYNGAFWEDLAKLVGTTNLFPDNQFVLSSILFEAGFGPDTPVSVMRFWLLVLLVVGGIALTSRPLLKTLQADAALKEFLFLRILNLAVLLIMVATIPVLLLKGNQWAASKNLYPVLAGLMIEVVWVAIGLVHSGWLRKTSLLTVLSGLVFLMFLNARPALERQWQTAQRIVTEENYGTIRESGALKVSQILRSMPPGVVWYEGDILNSILFYTLMRDSQWALLAPYPEPWIGSVTGYDFTHLFDPKQLPLNPREATYQKLMALPTVQTVDQLAVVIDRPMPLLQSQGFQVYSDVTLGFVSPRELLDPEQDFFERKIVQQMRLQVQFPQTLSSGIEPLVTTGRAKAREMVYFDYLATGEAVIGFNHWGAVSVNSQPFSVQPGRSYELDITLDRVKNQVVVRLDGQKILDHDVALYPAYRSIRIGENLFDGGTGGVALKFSGVIRRLL